MGDARIVALEDIETMRKITNSIACMARVAADLRVSAELSEKKIENGPAISGINDGIEMLADMVEVILDRVADPIPWMNEERRRSEKTDLEENSVYKTYDIEIKEEVERRVYKDLEALVAMDNSKEWRQFLEESLNEEFLKADGMM